MARRPKAGTTASAVKVMQDAATVIPLPQGSTLPSEAVPIFNQIIGSRPRDTWSPADKIMAVKLASILHVTELLEAALREDDLFIPTGNGGRKSNPLLGEIRNNIALAISLQRSLQVHAVSTTSANAGNMREACQEMRDLTGEAQPNNVIAWPTYDPANPMEGLNGTY